MTKGQPRLKGKLKQFFFAGRRSTEIPKLVPKAMSASKSTQSRVQCPYCPKDYSTKGGLRQHMDKHHPEPDQPPKYQCQFCYRNHACNSNLLRHLLNCKSNPDRLLPSEGAFRCCVCDYRCKQKGGLKGHMNKKHTEEEFEAFTVGDAVVMAALKFAINRC